MNSWVISNFFRDVTKMGNREQGTGNREQGTGNREWGTGGVRMRHGKGKMKNRNITENLK